VTINSDISRSTVIPGVYGQISLSSGSKSLGNTTKGILLVGYKASGGIAAYNVPVEVTGDADINAQVGMNSDLAEDARAAFDTPGVRGTVKVQLLPIPAPTGGVAQILTMSVVSAPTSGAAPGSNTAATASGQWLLYIDGHVHAIAIVLGDTLATVAATAVAAIADDLQLRWSAADTGSGNFTLTCRHTGKTGLDGVVRIDYGDTDVGLRLSPGTLTFTGTTSATGTSLINVGAQTVSTAIANPSTPTLSATTVAASVNAGGYAVTAASLVGAVTLYLAHLRDYRFATTSLTGATGQTVAGVFGTAGSGDPDLTTALNIMAGQPSVTFWATRLVHSSPLGALVGHITTYNNGKFQKSQILCVNSAQSGSAWGSVISGTSPNMTAAPQYWNVAWNQPDAPESQSNLAVRLAGYMASLDYVALNMDRVLVRTLGQAPLLIPAVGSRPDPDTRNADMLSLGISPIVVFSDNQNHVDSAKTTIIRATASDVRTCELSCIRSALYQRAYINAAVDQLLFTDDGGKNFRADGEVHTPYVVTADQVTQCIINALRELSNRDVIQNVEANKDLVQFSAEPGDPTVINYFIPFDPVVPLHIFNYKQALV
jgi:phage tail sheath gpL-like